MDAATQCESKGQKSTTSLPITSPRTAQTSDCQCLGTCGFTPYVLFASQNNHKLSKRIQRSTNSLRLYIKHAHHHLAFITDCTAKYKFYSQKWVEQRQHNCHILPYFMCDDTFKPLTSKSHNASVITANPMGTVVV